MCAGAQKVFVRGRGREEVMQHVTTVCPHGLEQISYLQISYIYGLDHIKKGEGLFARPRGKESECNKYNTRSLNSQQPPTP